MTNRTSIRLISTIDLCALKMNKANCQDSENSVAGFVFPFDIDGGTWGGGLAPPPNFLAGGGEISRKNL